MLDLCCGTGQVARALSERGLRVTGLDAADAMLRFARENAPGADFIQADARRFSLPRRFAGALSMFNSLAHVDSAVELEMVFAHVRQALLPGAVFLFDLNMEDAYASKWRGSFNLLGNDYACMARLSYDSARRLGRNAITVFRSGHQPQAPAGHPGWERSDFSIEQKCHTEAEVRQALTSTGFSDINSYDAQRDLDIAGEWGRRFFAAVSN